MLVTFGACFKQHFDTRYMVFYNPSPPKMSLDLLWEYRIQHGANGPLYVTSSYSTWDILQGSVRLCNWLSLRRLVSWINHLPPACWSTFWKSNFKQQLGCRFDIMDNKSYFFCVLKYIRSFFGFTFLNILYFSKYSCTNIFHGRSLYTFYFGFWPQSCSKQHLQRFRIWAPDMLGTSPVTFSFSHFSTHLT